MVSRLTVFFLLFWNDLVTMKDEYAYRGAKLGKDLDTLRICYFMLEGALHLCK